MPLNLYNTTIFSIVVGKRHGRDGCVLHLHQNKLVQVLHTQLSPLTFLQILRGFVCVASIISQ